MDMFHRWQLEAYNPEDYDDFEPGPEDKERDDEPAENR